MVKMSGVYQGDKHCEMTHGPSGSKIVTDAPKDNNGRGEAFSPTDLLGASLGSCVLTTIAIVCERDGVQIKGANFEVTKEMHPNPRRVERLSLTLNLPANLEPEYRKKLEQIAKTCPVHRSLHPDVQMPMQFHYIV